MRRAIWLCLLMAGVFAAAAGCPGSGTQQADDGSGQADAAPPGGPPKGDDGAQPPAGEGRPAGGGRAAKIDTALIPADAFGVAVVDVERLRAAPELKGVSLESVVPPTAGQGLDPANVKQMMMVMIEPGAGEADPSSALILRFHDAEAAREFEPPVPGEFRPDDTTVVFGQPTAVERIRAAKDEKSLVIDRLAAMDAAHDLVVVVNGAKAGLAVGGDRERAAEQLPSFAVKLFEVLDKTEAATLTASISADPLARLVIEPKSGESPADVKKLADEALRGASGFYTLIIRGQLRQQNPDAAALIDKLLTALRLTEEDGKVVATAHRPQGFKEDLAKVVAPLIQRMEESMGQEGSRKNLRQIGLAIHNYHEVMRSLPPAYVADADGKPLLSWRVLVLPYLEQNNLFRQIRLNEPWDSEHNKQFHDKMPPVFAFPGAKAKDGIANYMIAYGGEGEPHTMFKSPRLDGEGKFRSQTTFVSCIDGLSNIVMIFEVAGSEVNWMEPRDLSLEAATAPINSASDGSCISSPWEGGANAVFGDGSLHFLPNSTPKETLRRLLLCNDREPVQLP